MKIKLAFCPTGPGGGVDPSCSPHGGTGPNEHSRAAFTASQNATKYNTRGHHSQAAEAHARAAAEHRAKGNKAQAARHDKLSVFHDKQAQGLQAKSDAAKHASDKAVNAKDHREAASAHREAAHAHKEAGNHAQAHAHQAAASHHSFLASAGHVLQEVKHTLFPGGGGHHHGSSGGGGRGGGGGGGAAGARGGKKRPKIRLSFCPTGAGGGVDNSCGKYGDKLQAQRVEFAKTQSGIALKASQKAETSDLRDHHIEAAHEHEKAARAHKLIGDEKQQRHHEDVAVYHYQTARTVKIKLAFCPTGPGGGVDNSCASSLSAKANALGKQVQSPSSLQNARDLSKAHGEAAKAHRAIYENAVKLGVPHHEGSPAGFHLAKAIEHENAATQVLNTVNNQSAASSAMVLKSQAAEQKSKNVADAEKAGKSTNKELAALHREAMRKHSEAQSATMKTGQYSKYHDEMRVYHTNKARAYAKLK